MTPTMSTGGALASDAELLDGVARGEAGALAELYERYGTFVHGLAAGLSGRDGADLVVRSVFMEVWHSPRVATGSVKALLTLATHRRAVDGRGPAARGRLLRLPDGQREAIALAYDAGCTCSEIALVLETTETSVKRDLRAGLVELSRIG